jgi:hypothetical protein
MPQFRINPLVEERLHASGAESAVRISGYIGPASQEEFTRLYQDLSLCSYIELRREDIVDVEEAESDKEPAQIHLRRDAQIEVHSVASVGASWLETKLEPLLLLQVMAEPLKPRPDPWNQDLFQEAWDTRR